MAFEDDFADESPWMTKEPGWATLPPVEPAYIPTDREVARSALNRSEHPNQTLFQIRVNLLEAQQARRNYAAGGQEVTSLDQEIARLHKEVGVAEVVFGKQRAESPRFVADRGKFLLEVADFTRNMSDYPIRNPIKLAAEDDAEDFFENHRDHGIGNYTNNLGERFRGKHNIDAAADCFEYAFNHAEGSLSSGNLEINWQSIYAGNFVEMAQQKYQADRTRALDDLRHQAGNDLSQVPPTELEQMILKSPELAEFMVWYGQKVVSVTKMRAAIQFELSEKFPDPATNRQIRMHFEREIGRLDFLRQTGADFRAANRPATPPTPQPNPQAPPIAAPAAPETTPAQVPEVITITADHPLAQINTFLDSAPLGMSRFQIPPQSLPEIIAKIPALQGNIKSLRVAVRATQGQENQTLIINGDLGQRMSGVKLNNIRVINNGQGGFQILNMENLAYYGMGGSRRREIEATLNNLNQLLKEQLQEQMKSQGCRVGNFTIQGDQLYLTVDKLPRIRVRRGLSPTQPLAEDRQGRVYQPPLRQRTVRVFNLRTQREQIIDNPEPSLAQRLIFGARNRNQTRAPSQPTAPDRPRGGIGGFLSNWRRRRESQNGGDTSDFGPQVINDGDQGSPGSYESARSDSSAAASTDALIGEARDRASAMSGDISTTKGPVDTNYDNIPDVRIVAPGQGDYYGPVPTVEAVQGGFNYDNLQQTQVDDIGTDADDAGGGEVGEGGAGGPA